MTHALSHLLNTDYRAGAMETCLRLIAEYENPRYARDLLRQIDASRTLSPEMFAVEIEAATGFDH